MSRSSSTNRQKEEPSAQQLRPVERMAARLAQQVERGEVSLDTALYIVVADIRALTNADGAAIAYRSDSGEIVCRAAVGAAPDVGVVLRPDSGLSGECIRTARPMICADTENDPRVNATAAAALAAHHRHHQDGARP